MNLTDVQRTVEKYIPLGLFLDTNLMVLLVVGAVNRRRIARHKRTQHYSAGDYDVLVRFARRFPRLVTTPHVLAETSNLLGKSSTDEKVMLKTLCIDVWQEQATVSRDAATRPEYPYLGLADAGILHGIVGSYLVLTDDEQLVYAIQMRTEGALLFDAVRTIAALS